MHPVLVIFPLTCINRHEPNIETPDTNVGSPSELRHDGAVSACAIFYEEGACQFTAADAGATRGKQRTRKCLATPIPKIEDPPDNAKNNKQTRLNKGVLGGY
jgi:hypothetical protein